MVEGNNKFNKMPLGDLISYFKGFAFKSKDYSTHGTKIVRVSDMLYDTIDENSGVNIPDSIAKRLEKYKLQSDDLLITTVGSKPPTYSSLVGRAVIVEEKITGALLNQNSVCLRANIQIYQRFLNQNFKSTRYINFLKKIIRGNANQGSIRLEDLFKYEIPVPIEIEEQKAIAETLGDIDQLVNKLDDLIEKKKNIKKGTMQNLLTGKKRLPGFSGEWEEKDLGSMCHITTGKLDANAMVDNGQYRFYTCAKKYYYINTYEFDGEALLVSGNGANVGYVHYYNGKFNAYQRTYVLTEFNENALYLKIYLDQYISKRIDEEVNAGNTPYIKMDTLTEMKIKLPKSFEEQEAIAKVLTDMDEEIKKLESRLDKYKDIKQGMMEEILTGKTRLV